MMGFPDDAPPIWKEWPNAVPQPQAWRMVLMRLRAASFVIGLISPWLSLQQNNGSEGPAGVTLAMFSKASMGQRLDAFCVVTNTDWISPMAAVLAVGRSS